MKHIKKYLWIILVVVILIVFLVPFFTITVSGCGLAPGGQTFKKYNLATILIYGGELGCGLKNEIY